MTELTAYYLARLSLSEAVLYVAGGGNSNDLTREMRARVAGEIDRLAKERCGRQSPGECRMGNILQSEAA